MTDDELYDHAQQTCIAIWKGDWDAAVAAARRLADRAVLESAQSAGTKFK